jgi:predicted metalloprotease with PDZ domain
MIGDLLWVYEGLTEYLGQIFAARSGLLTPEQYRQELAGTAAEMDRARPGRTWRNLQDTATDAQDLYATTGEAWTSWRRSTDFYPESELIWLEADTIIRTQTHDQKSLDDFGKLFHGAPSTAPEVKPYTFDDVVNALNQIAPYDWRNFFVSRLQSHGPGAPLGGIENSGWKLTYSETKPEVVRAAEDARYFVDCRYSLGFTVSTHNETIIPDVIIGSPAYQAGIGPGMFLVAVNGQKFDYDHAHILADALRAAKNSSQPIQLLVRNGDYFKTYEINYHEGEKYPVLQRDSAKPDVLSQIIAPHATANRQ